MESKEEQGKKACTSAINQSNVKEGNSKILNTLQTRQVDRQVIRVERGEELERNADCKCQLKANADGKEVGEGDTLKCHVRI